MDGSTGSGSDSAHGDGGARRFETRRCTSRACGLRFPVDVGSELGRVCPHCGHPTETVDDPFVTHGANVAAECPDGGPDLVTAHGGPRLGALLDNVRSLRNVGSMLRTADGVGLELMVLAGITPHPDHPKMAKTALGAERTVPWRGVSDGTVAAASLVAEGWSLWALEGGPRSRSLFEPGLVAPPGARVMLVVGHEVAGVDPRILGLCERVIHLPMLGSKGSLNVSVAFGIAVYALRFAMAR